MYKNRKNTHFDILNKIVFEVAEILKKKSFNKVELKQWMNEWMQGLLHNYFSGKQDDLSLK